MLFGTAALVEDRGVNMGANRGEVPHRSVQAESHEANPALAAVERPGSLYYGGYIAGAAVEVVGIVEFQPASLYESRPRPGASR
jgi:hypothetical protein